MAKPGERPISGSVEHKLADRLGTQARVHTTGPSFSHAPWGSGTMGGTSGTDTGGGNDGEPSGPFIKATYEEPAFIKPMDEEPASLSTPTPAPRQVSSFGTKHPVLAALGALFGLVAVVWGADKVMDRVVDEVSGRKRLP